MKYRSDQKWSASLKEQNIAYPSEYVIRIFKGEFPNLKWDKTFENKKILDVGCGDGRNIVLLDDCGFETHGIEVSESIVTQTENKLKSLGVDANIKHGFNAQIPYGNDYFDYLLSWNACYYMPEGDNDFSKNVEEFSRVLHSDGYLVLSIPKKTCFIYKGSEELSKGYQIIRQDPFNIRNGDILRMFEDENEIKDVFSSHFKNFMTASIHDDCFGYDYHWHLLVCQKK